MSVLKVFAYRLMLSERGAIEPQASSRGRNHRAPGRVGWVQEGP